MLEKIDKNKNPFKVPENYFENFNVDIMDQLPEKNKAKIVPMWRKVVPWATVAAVLGGVIFTVGLITSQSQDAAMADVEEEFQIEDISVPATGLASVGDEDFYLFLEDEALTSAYKDMVYSSY